MTDQPPAERAVTMNPIVRDQIIRGLDRQRDILRGIRAETRDDSPVAWELDEALAELDALLDVLLSDTQKKADVSSAFAAVRRRAEVIHAMLVKELSPETPQS